MDTEILKHGNRSGGKLNTVSQALKSKRKGKNHQLLLQGAVGTKMLQKPREGMGEK